MEVVISAILGGWIMLAGILCFVSYKKDTSTFLGNDEENKEERK